MKQIKNIIWLFIIAPLFFMQSCVKDEDNIFDDSAAARGQKAVAEYRELLASAENGWYVDYYPELNHKEGGYAMYLKFTADGMVDVSCEIQTNVPPRQIETSQFEVFMEQGPILSFTTYNKVMHYFTEPYATDINGREGDYEFIIMQAEADRILIKGKKGENKMTLRRNTANLNPDAHLAEIADFADILSEFALFEFRIDDDVIGSAAVTNRTFDVEYTVSRDNEKISYAFTPTGIRLYEPFEINGMSVENFIWDDASEQYTSADPNTNVVLKSYFPDDYQLRYEEFLGTWKMEYQARNSSTWFAGTFTDTVEFITIKRNETFMMKCDKIFNFAGITLFFDLQKGVVSFYGFNTDVHSSGNDIRQCPYATLAGYLNTGVYPSSRIGMTGIWNNDENNKRTITFEDNKIWGTYIVDGILLRLYDASNVSQGNYTGNINGIYGIRNLVLTKID